MIGAHESIFRVYMGDLFDIEPPVKLMRYSVCLHKNGDKIGEFKIGHVVTHLSIQDWCELHGYTMLSLFVTHLARSDERTNLF